MNTMGDVVEECQGLLGDADGEWVSLGYILPFINTTYRMEYLAIKAGANGRNLEQVIELPNVVAGTTTLYPFQATGKALSGLYDPLRLWWKIAGQPWGCYSPVAAKETLPFVGAPGAQSNSPTICPAWTWRGNQLTVTPLNAAIDILVDGRFNPPPLTKNDDILIVSPDMQSPLALGAAALAGVERTNPAVLESYSAQAAMGIDNIIAGLITQKQIFSKRLGRLAPSCGWGWYR